MFYAHRTESHDKEDWQKLTDHLHGVADRAAQHASYFRGEEWAALAGKLHDAGKFSEAFQRRLNGSPFAVDHATAGAQYIGEAWGKAIQHRILSYVIAGHHAGLADFGSDAADERTLAMRLKKEIEPYQHALEEYMPNVAGSPFPPPIKPGIHPGLQFSLFTRMLFSCLVDADSLDTEQYADRKTSTFRGNHALMGELLHRYEQYIAEKFPFADTPINIARAELQQECLSRAGDNQGMYTLTLPTGSGKTLISLGFALRHAVHHQLRRIIYAIPYTSIIEQNANVFREAVGSENVLEHHSNVQHESDDNLEVTEEVHKLRKKLMNSEENWDHPVVVTTNVQFFESLFANKRARCRKLHNLTGSVIVLDEAQMMNGEFFKPCLCVLEELVRNYGVTAILSTATQPNVQALFDKPVQLHEMVKDLPHRFEQFRRVRLEPLGTTDYGHLSERMLDDKQALCIVNTRKAARELYKQLKDSSDNNSVFHLSARMCPKHRLKKLNCIRKRLDGNLPCILVSTQLIECGVDVDFPVVYRELAGLDSIAQAAGRCNRNGKRPICTTYVFQTESSHLQGWFGITAKVAQSIMNRYPEDPLSLTAIEAYFQELFFYQTLGSGNSESGDKTDKHQILKLLNEQATQLAFPFETIAHKFQLIDTATKPVIVAFDDEAEKHLDSLLYAHKISGVMRKLQPYIVQLYPQEFNAFRQAGEIVEVRENVFKLLDANRWYDEDIGIKPFSADFHMKEIFVV